MDHSWDAVGSIQTLLTEHKTRGAGASVRWKQRLNESGFPSARHLLAIPLRGAGINPLGTFPSEISSGEAE